MCVLINYTAGTLESKSVTLMVNSVLHRPRLCSIIDHLSSRLDSYEIKIPNSLHGQTGSALNPFRKFPSWEFHVWQFTMRCEDGKSLGGRRRTGLPSLNDTFYYPIISRMILAHVPRVFWWQCHNIFSGWSEHMRSRRTRRHENREWLKRRH